jgi:hypothetical protein
MQSLLSFVLPLGETIGISMMGAVFTNKLGHFTSSIPGYGGAQNLATLDGLSGPVKAAVQNAAAKSVMWALITVLPFVGLSIIASILLGNVWIGKIAEEKGQARQEAARGHVLYGVYVLALIRGSVAADQQELDVNAEYEPIREKVLDVESYRTTTPQTAYIRQESR